MAAAEPAWSLVLCKGQPRADRPATIELHAGTTTIGREEGDVDVHLDSTSFPKLISRLHCRLAANADHVVLQDCSVNGCSVDGATVRRAALSEGSTIVFGPRGSTTEFAYRLQKHEGGSADGAARKRARTEEEPSSVPAKPEEPGKRKEPPAKPVEPAEEAAGPEEAGLGAEELNRIAHQRLLQLLEPPPVLQDRPDEPFALGQACLRPSRCRLRRGLLSTVEWTSTRRKASQAGC